MPDPLTNFQVEIEKLVYGGDGLARKEGRVLLAPYVLPGETIEVGETLARNGVLRVVAPRVISPVQGRTEPACAYYARCGGCHYQHAEYELEKAQKISILRETFLRVGRIDPGDIGMVAAEPWGYRNRTQFHLTGGRIGYLEPRSHRLVDVEQCPISSPRLNRALSALREMMKDPRWPAFVRSIELFTNEREVQVNLVDTERPVARRFFDWCAEKIEGAGDGTLEYPAAGFQFRVGGRSFFQVNRFLLDHLVETALAGAGGGTALDLYAGVGLFSLPLAGRFRAVTAVESGGGAARDLRFNADRAARQVTVSQTPVELFMQDLSSAPDFVLADPPRAGLGKVVVRRLCELRPKRIAIVACDPATLARDLAGLVHGGYHIERVTAVDLFPRTFHIETVVLLATSA